MSSISLYSFEDAAGNEVGCWTTTSAQEARDFARKNGLNVRCNEFEYADSYLVDEWSYAKEAS